MQSAELMRADGDSWRGRVTKRAGHGADLCVGGEEGSWTSPMEFHTLLPKRVVLLISVSLARLKESVRDDKGLCQGHSHNGR